MEKEHLVSMRSEVNALIKEAILNHKKHDYPVIINFRQGMLDPSYKITIEKVDIDIFVDCNGQKWKKVYE